MDNSSYSGISWVHDSFIGIANHNQWKMKCLHTFRFKRAFLQNLHPPSLASVQPALKELGQDTFSTDLDGVRADTLDGQVYGGGKEWIYMKETVCFLGFATKPSKGVALVQVGKSKTRPRLVRMHRLCRKCTYLFVQSPPFSQTSKGSERPAHSI